MGAMAVRQKDDTKPSSCGRLSENFTMKVIDPDSGEILGPNKVGEGCFKYPFMMSCYYGNPEATSEAIDSEGTTHLYLICSVQMQISRQTAAHC